MIIYEIEKSFPIYCFTNSSLVPLFLGLPCNTSLLTTYEQVEHLSGGEKQILGILHILIADRAIILMGESFSNIDNKNIQIIKNYIMSLEDKIIIEVTHHI